MSKRKGTQSAETPHKRIRVSSLSEEDNDDEEEIVCPSQPNAVQCPSSSSSAESGIVESISLRNFMCHSLLGPFNFGPNVNFVVGNNGSGKSAVLTALIVALGGKAQTTNRGSALKGFVKEGENSADVSVTLKNRGRDAYRAEVYGQAITIDVRISGEGLRTYKLKSKSGQLVSSKKEELLAVMDHFNIQVDNPVSILTQEMSKHFLHSKGEGDKYKFFMKATQLEQMKEDYAYIMKTKTVIQNTVDTHEEKLQELKRKYQEKEERFKSLASLDDMQQKLDELKDQMAWALVTEMEREVNPMRERIANEERATVKYEQKVEQWKGKVAEAERKYKEVHDQLQSVTDRLQELQPERAQLKKQVQERNATFKRAENAFHRVKTNLKDLGKDKEQLTKRISELRYNISQLSAVDSQARAERMERLQAQLDTLNSQDATLAQQIDQFQQASTSAKDQHTRISCEMKDQQRSVDSKRRELAALEGSRGDRLRRFGEQMPALLAAVEEAHRHGQFKRKPIGPLGYCIRLRDAGLALAVESCLKSLMLAFCCDNYRDERQLQAIMARHCPQGRRPQIIVSEFTTTLYDTSRGAVKHPDYPTVLQSLEIDDPVVTNCLIDMRGIETILLIKNKKEARRVMQAGPPPQNCREAFTADGDQVYTNRYYSSDHHRALYLSRDVEEEIRHMQGVVQSQEKKMQSLKQQMQQQAFDQQQNEIHLQRVHDDRKRAKEHIRRLQLEINELQNVEEPQSEDLRPLEEELEELGGRLCKAQEEGEAARMKMEEMREAWGEADRQYRQNVDTMNRVAEEAEPVKEELSRSDEEVERSKHHKKHYEEKLKAHISNIDSLRDSLAQKEQELKDSVAKASEICPGRVDVRRTAKSLDSEISRLKQKITAQQDQQGDRETIIRQYQEAMDSYKNIAHQVKNLKCFIQLLSKTMNTRHKVFMEFRMWLSVRCKYYFDSMLSQRGYTGKMTFDHKNETLSISVQPGEGDKASLSDMRSLSGGERSFSTVCFVLSLWAITEAPFRCLDEFDVYMDMVNRKISLDMMQKIASSQRYRQFIFLTPQSMSSVKVSNLTRVLRLKDPDRSQTTLPFGQRNQQD